MLRSIGRRSARPVILRYHRIAEPGGHLAALAVSPRRFEEQLEVLARLNPVPLADLVHALRTGRLPAPAVALTFDDGYADNLTHALPALQRRGIPATVFVVTGDGFQEREFWWDRLAEAMPRSPASAFQQAFELLLELPDSERESRMNALQPDAGGIAVGSPHRSLTGEGIRQLAASGLVDIGAHTVTHPVLRRLSEERQWAEIAGSKAALDALLGMPVTGFAYPYGRVGGTDALVRRAGYGFACTTAEDLVHARQDPYRLPRLYVGDWDGEEFTRRLAKWMRVG